MLGGAGFIASRRSSLDELNTGTVIPMVGTCLNWTWSYPGVSRSLLGRERCLCFTLWCTFFLQMTPAASTMKFWERLLLRSWWERLVELRVKQKNNKIDCAVESFAMKGWGSVNSFAVHSIVVFFFSFFFFLCVCVCVYVVEEGSSLRWCFAFTGCVCLSCGQKTQWCENVAQFQSRHGVGVSPGELYTVVCMCTWLYTHVVRYQVLLNISPMKLTVTVHLQQLQAKLVAHNPFYSNHSILYVCHLAYCRTVRQYCIEMQHEEKFIFHKERSS